MTETECAEVKSWVGKYGSELLCLLYLGGYSWMKTYADERCAMEHPGWVVETVEGDYYVVSAGDAFLEELKEATKHNARVVVIRSKSKVGSPGRSIGVYYSGGFWAFRPMLTSGKVITTNKGQSVVEAIKFLCISAF